MNFWNYLPELWLRLGEHLELTFAAVFVAAAIGYPLAALTWNRPHLRVFIQSLCNLFQTIPSLALLALLLPFLGLGFLPAVVALILYAILPIVRSTYTALSDADPDQIDAGRMLGMSSLQLLWYVRLPAGLPQLISGLRTAFVWSVGTATLSAFIGAGGLGQFITAGLARNNTGLLLLGAIPAALLALGIDLILGRCEEIALAWKNGQPMRRTPCFIYWIFAGLIALILFSVLQPIGSHLPHDQKPLIRVGAKNFIEQMILGEIMAQKIETTGKYRVERKFGLGSTSLIHESLVTGQIDLYVEYSGTAEQNTLKLAATIPDPAHTELKRLYREKFDLLWLDSLGFSNSYALVVPANGRLSTLTAVSQIVPAAPSLRAGLNAEFIDRPDGYPALQRAYGLRFGSVKSLDVGLIYPALDARTVDIAVAFSTDGELATPSYHALADDKNAFPRYDAAPVLRSATAREHPDLPALLNSLAGTINEETMRHLNREVQAGSREPAQVARDFLNSLPK